jgi:hypothetical protein
MGDRQLGYSKAILTWIVALCKSGGRHRCDSGAQGQQAAAGRDLRMPGPDKRCLTHLRPLSTPTCACWLGTALGRHADTNEY